MAINLNNTTPAAPANNANVSWQKDGSGNVSAYLPATAQKLSGVDATAQAANIVATNLVATPVAGAYKISAYVIVTQAGTVSSTMPSVVLTWTDNDNATPQTLTLTATSAGNLLTTFAQASALINASTVAIQYSTTGYATSGATSMQYALHIRVEYLG